MASPPKRRRASRQFVLGGNAFGFWVLAFARFLSSPIILRASFSYCSVLIRDPKNKKGNWVLLRNLWETKLVWQVMRFFGCRDTGASSECLAAVRTPASILPLIGFNTAPNNRSGAHGVM